MHWGFGATGGASAQNDWKKEFNNGKDGFFSAICVVLCFKDSLYFFIRTGENHTKN